MDIMIDPPETGTLEDWDAYIAKLKAMEPRTQALENEIEHAEKDRAHLMQLQEIRSLLEEAARDPHWGPALEEARQQALKDGDFSRYDALMTAFMASRA